jgi:SAM-dependent methyltransferase
MSRQPESSASGDVPGSLGWAVEWRRWLWLPAVRRTLSAVPDWSNLRVCELGSRSGRLAVHLATRGAEVVGFDVDGVDLDPARELADTLAVGPRVQFHNYNGDTSSLDDRFDVVVTKSVLVAMPVGKAVDSVRRLVKDGGCYLGTENIQLPAIVNRIRSYPSLGLSRQDRRDLQRAFSSTSIRTTYRLVASIVARA